MEHKNISIADQIFERLENDILTGIYPRGEILTEIKLSEELGVSRTPIREALHRLEQEKLLEFIPKGAKVIGITIEDIKIIYEMRVRIEGLAAALACENASEEQLNSMKEYLDLQEFYCGKPDTDNIKKMDSSFHDMLYKASGSAHLSHILNELHTKTGKYRKVSVSNQSRAALSVKEHRAILEAILDKDANKAEALTIAHVKNAMNNILSRN